MLPGDVDLDRVPVEFRQVKGTIVPRAVHDEVFSATRREMAWERVAERLKTLQSRTVLGALNVNWLQADFLSNAALAMFQANVGPVTLVRSMRFFKRLPPELRHRLEAEIATNNARFQTHIPHLGSSVNGRWVNTWRALRATPLGQKARPIQKTINAFLAAEQAIANDTWRKAVAYRMLRNEALVRMDRNAGALNAVLDRLVTVSRHSPEKQMYELLRDDRALPEYIGRLTDEVLGDFTTMTAVERRTAGRFLFFCPWLRFSTRAAFYTLPMNHPVRVSIAARIGELTEEEQRELLGVRDDEKGVIRGLDGRAGVLPRRGRTDPGR